MIIGHALERLKSLPGTALAHALHDLLPREVKILMKGVTVPVRGLGSRDRSCGSCSRSMDRLRSRGQRLSLHDSSHSPSALVRSCGPGRGSLDCYWSRLWSRRLRSRLSGRREARRDRSRSHWCRYRSRDRSPLSSERSWSMERSWRPGRSCRDCEEAVVASRDRGNSGSRVDSAPVVAGGSIPRLTPSLPDLARLFLSLSGFLAQWDAGVTSAGVLPGPAAPVTSAAPVACPSASVPAPGVVTPAGAASATGSSS